MKRFLLGFIFFIYFIFAVSVEAKEEVFTFNLDKFSLKNPFESQLPIKEKVILKKDKPVKKKVINEKAVKIPVQKSIAIKKSSQQIQKMQNKGSGKNKNIKENQEPQASSLEANVTGLIWNSNRPQAIVDGEVLEIGDKINGMEIVSIQKTGIEVKFSEKTFKIKSIAQGQKESVYGQKKLPASLDGIFRSQ